MKNCPVDADLVYAAIKQHKNEILEDCDWWFTVGNYDLNVFCYEDEPYEPDALFSINLYELDEGETSSYSKQSQYDLPQMTRKEIRLL
jgi:hypothetical protein